MRSDETTLSLSWGKGVEGRELLTSASSSMSASIRAILSVIPRADGDMSSLNPCSIASSSL